MRPATAELLAYIAEFDARKLYALAGYASMFAYCVGELGLSEDAARKRIHAARTAREYPAVFAAVADGRLNLTAVVLLAPCLTRETADELLGAAARKTRIELEILLAERFPRPDVPTRLLAIPATPEPVPMPEPVPAPCQRAPGRVELPPPARLKPGTTRGPTPERRTLSALR